MARKKLHFELQINAAKSRLTVLLNGGVNRVLPVHHESFPGELQALKQEIEALRGSSWFTLENDDLLDLSRYNRKERIQ